MTEQMPKLEADSEFIADPTMQALRRAIAGKQRLIATGWLFTGPAVVASVAYMDPGNFATNIQAGSKFGYQLLWIVVSANLIAMLFQALSAKIGIVTDKNLAELCREEVSLAGRIGMWLMSEVAAMATDVAEFLGAAIGLSLLMGLPLLVGMTAVAVFTYAILAWGGAGFRKMELLIGVFVATIGVCYLIELFVAPVAWQAAALGSVIPSMPNQEALLISVGIVGATVMPHALYLHSALTQGRAPVRSSEERRKVLKFSNLEVVIALGFAGVINMAMVIMAAAAFSQGHADVAEIETAYHTLSPLLGAGAALVFLISLLASGLSSSVVGTMAGQVILQGFFRVRIPIWVRRCVTMAPAFVVVAMGVSATKALVLSQVILSLALPVPMVALLMLTSNRRIMGTFVNSRGLALLAGLCTVLVLALNLILIYETIA